MNRRERAARASAEAGVVPGGFNAAMAVSGALEAYEEGLRGELGDDSMTRRFLVAYDREVAGTVLSDVSQIHRVAVRVALEAALFGEYE